MEQRALFRLEKELEATLRFEHGGWKHANRILLGHLFRERLALGWVVKVFA